jgi:zinc/manganese transport system permease protein
MISILLPAFILSVILLGIHSYFGLEIIRRGIIFTDLAIGQMAALGAGVSILFLGGAYLYPVSLASALAGGLLIAYASKKIRNLETFIGMVYAAGFSGAFVLLSKSPHGMEDFQNLMASDILFTSMHEMLKTGLIYAFLGLFIFFFNKKTKGFLRDVLFFVTFAVTVTSSVRMAGVLIVFALLVAPAFVSINIQKGNLLLKAWGIGTAINLAAIIISYNLDLPTGYTLVFAQAAIAVIFSIVKKTNNNEVKIA